VWDDLPALNTSRIGMFCFCDIFLDIGHTVFFYEQRRIVLSDGTESFVYLFAFHCGKVSVMFPFLSTRHEILSVTNVLGLVFCENHIVS